MKEASSKDLEDILLGKQLCLLRRTGGMPVMHFGKLIVDGKDSWGEICIHIQTYWRVLVNNLFYTGEGDQSSDPSDQIDVIGLQPGRTASYLDYKLQRLFGRADPVHHSILLSESRHSIARVRLDSGNLHLGFADGDVSIEI